MWGLGAALLSDLHRRGKRYGTKEEGQNSEGTNHIIMVCGMVVSKLEAFIRVKNWGNLSLIHSH